MKQNILNDCFQPCNKSLINQACSGPYWENISPRSFMYGPIFSQYGPRAWLIKYMYLLQPRSQGFSLLNWVGGNNSKGKSPGNEVVSFIHDPCSLHGRR